MYMLVVHVYLFSGWRETKASQSVTNQDLHVLHTWAMHDITWTDAYYPNCWNRWWEAPHHPPLWSDRYIIFPATGGSHRCDSRHDSQNSLPPWSLRCLGWILSWTSSGKHKCLHEVRCRLFQKYPGSITLKWDRGSKPPTPIHWEVHVSEEDSHQDSRGYCKETQMQQWVYTCTWTIMCIVHDNSKCTHHRSSCVSMYIMPLHIWGRIIHVLLIPLHVHLLHHRCIHTHVSACTCTCGTGGETGSTATYCHHEAVWGWCSYNIISNNGLPNVCFPWTFRECSVSYRWITHTLNVYGHGLHCNVWYAGNHTFASVKGPEEYTFLKAALDPVWKEIQELIDQPSVVVSGREIQLNIVFGSDYKVWYKTCTTGAQQNAKHFWYALTCMCIRIRRKASICHMFVWVYM